MRFVKIILVILISAIVLGAFYAMTLFSPAPYKPDELDETVNPNADAAALLSESEQLEREFEAAASTSAVPTPENMDKLRRAVRRLSSVVGSIPKWSTSRR